MNLNETIQRVKATLATWATSTKAFYRRNRLTVLGGLTIVSIMLVVWARLGFTFEINRFFANEPFPGIQDEDGMPASIPEGGGTGGNVTSVPKGASCVDGKIVVPGGPLCLNGVADLQNGTCTFDCPDVPKEQPSAEPPPQTTGCLANGGQNGGGNPAGDASCDFDGTGCEFGYCQADGTCDIRRSRCDDGIGGGGAPTTQQPGGGVPSGGSVAVVTAPAPVTLSVQCGSTQNVLTWTQNTGSESLTVLKNTDSADGVTIATLPATTRTYTDTQISTGHTYRYRIKNSPTTSSNFADCPVPTPTPTPTPTPSPTLTPTPISSPTALECAPLQQTVLTSQTVTLEAAGGTSPFQWYAPGGNPSEGTGAEFDTAYSTTGNYQIGLTDGVLNSTQCEVLVLADSIPVVPPSTGNLDIAVSGRNFSTGGAEGPTVAALGAQEIEIAARVVNRDPADIIDNVGVNAALPAGLTYVSGSTSINNAPTALDSVTTSGLALGAMGPGQEATVRFRVRVDGASFPAGQSQAIVLVQANADGSEAQSASVVIVVNRSVAAGQPGAVNTGPGETTLVALLLSAIMTLLYVSYTHSPAFRRREADRVAGDQGPLDFRS
jgi:uncharacterized repeat protein (TIGR01451 family)